VYDLEGITNENQYIGLSIIASVSKRGACGGISPKNFMTFFLRLVRRGGGCVPSWVGGELFSSPPRRKRSSRRRPNK